MKRIFYPMLAFFMAISIVACGTKTRGSESSLEETDQSISSTETNDDITIESFKDVYFVVPKSWEKLKMDNGLYFYPSDRSFTFAVNYIEAEDMTKENAMDKLRWLFTNHVESEENVSDVHVNDITIDDVKGVKGDLIKTDDDGTTHFSEYMVPLNYNGVLMFGFMSQEENTFSNDAKQIMNTVKLPTNE